MFECLAEWAWYFFYTWFQLRFIFFNWFYGSINWFTMLCYFLLCSKVTQLYIYIHSFSYSFPCWFITGYWIWFPVLYSRTLLFIHPIYNSLHLLIPISVRSSHWNYQSNHSATKRGLCFYKPNSIYCPQHPVGLAPLTLGDQSWTINFKVIMDLCLKRICSPAVSALVYTC